MFVGILLSLHLHVQLLFGIYGLYSECL